MLTTQSCVLQKKIYTEDLHANFQEQKEKFIVDKGLEGDELSEFDVYFSDATIEKDYDVVSYNQVHAWIPLRWLIFNRWEVKYRLHQYMHNAYCLDLLPSIDAMVVNADLSGVKYIRFKDSTKNEFIKPGKKEYSKGVIGSAGGMVRDDLNFFINGGAFLSRDLSCLNSIRHEFGLFVGFNQKNTTNLASNTQQTFRDGGFFTLNYKLVYSYNVSEYFSNTWNIGMKRNGLFTEIGLDVDAINITGNSVKTESGSTLISSTRSRQTTLISPGVYTGLRYAVNPQLSLNLGASIYPIGLGSIGSTKTSIQGFPDIKQREGSLLSVVVSGRVFFRMIFTL